MVAKLTRVKPNSDLDGQQAEAEVLFMSLGEGVIVTDAAARIIRINKAALDVLGYSENELLGKWFPEVIVAEDREGNALSNLERPIAQVFLTGKDVSERAYYRRKNGSKVAVSMTVSPVLLRAKPVGAIEVFRDISREVALEQAKDEFVAIASHQLRTPATAVKQYVGLLLEGYAEPLGESQKMFLERAYESNERQLQIVEEILKVTQLDMEKVKLALDDYDIREVAKEAADTTAGNFKARNQRVIFDLPEQAVMLRVDKDQLRIAIENLLENASNYSRKNKQIKIIVRQLKDRVRIVVKDQGVGIASEDYPKLFQKFSRIPNPLSVEVGGTGLGLYWATQIVHIHGGYIRVNSKLGKGSSFTINLPNDL